MGFFDDALNKTKEALDVAYKKTEEVVTIEKQKFDLTSVKSKLQKDFAKLGEIYFEEIKEKEELGEELGALISEIKEKIKKRDNLALEIQQAKNKRICEQCGAAIEKASTFCNNCGVKQTVDFGNEE